MEKSFKHRKELSEADQHIDALFKLYKRRPKKATGAVQPGDPSLLLTKDDCPDGLDPVVWRRFNELRDQKIAFEAVVRAKASELADATAFLQHRAAEEELHARKMDEAVSVITSLQQERVREAVDLDVIVRIEQGQVEITHEDPFDPLFDTAVLIHESAIHDLNAQTKKLGQAKVSVFVCLLLISGVTRTTPQVAHVKEKVERMKAVRTLEWELERLDMYGYSHPCLTACIDLYVV
jgi:hypothetical protein